MKDVAILIVDDNKMILSFLDKVLKDKYEIFSATNGEDALEKIEQNTIDLVISDVMMPVMDGFELCERIKSDLHTSHIPIILLTAQNTIQSKVEGLRNGADAYIEKPFYQEPLEAQIFSLLQNRTKIKDHFSSLPLAHFRSIATTKTDELFLENLQSLIEQNMTEEKLDVDFLAASVNMSRPAFYRKIKSVSNLSPYEMINLIKLKKAAELLNNSDYNINEVAAIVGYASTAQFSKNFKRQFGINPSQYLRNTEKDQ
jgi:DNA-binding response OmpR family regulator